MKRTHCYQPKRAGQARGESLKTLSRFFDGMTVPTFIMNKKHIVTHWNTACAKLTGVPAVDIIGTRNAWRAFYPRKRPVLTDFIVDASSESAVAWYYDGRYTKPRWATGGFEAEKYFPYVGGEGLWLQFAATALRDASGRIISAIETLQDVTLRRQAVPAISERRERLQALIDVMPDVICFKDGSGHWLPI